ncbi:rubredoxin [Desulfatibacillum aliphaticivorans]|uniref:rubredoxin n=1 Tax=Desulfatibacillum aliphaticivorans TaxID=218208 RepID=UPI000A029D6E|nr:rubredoxin [Desulfatibacillum aliphaticivorans]
MDQYLCEVCGYVYDPHKGDRESQTSPGTAFQDLKQDWTCPVCSGSRRHFEKRQEDLRVRLRKV